MVEGIVLVGRLWWQISSAIDVGLHAKTLLSSGGSRLLNHWLPFNLFDFGRVEKRLCSDIATDDCKSVPLFVFQTNSSKYSGISNALRRIFHHLSAYVRK